MSARVGYIVSRDGKQLHLTSFAGGRLDGRCLQFSIWKPLAKTSPGDQGDFVQLTRAQVEELERALARWLAGETEAA